MAKKKRKIKKQPKKLKPKKRVNRNSKISKAKPKPKKRVGRKSSVKSNAKPKRVKRPIKANKPKQKPKPRNKPRKTNKVVRKSNSSVVSTKRGINKRSGKRSKPVRKTTKIVPVTIKKLSKVINKPAIEKKPVVRKSKISQETLLDFQKNIKKLDKSDYFTGTKKQIDEQKQRIKDLETRNGKIRYQRKKIQDAIKSRGGKYSGEQKQKLLNILNNDPLLKPLPLDTEKNYLAMLQGKDFYHIVDLHFKKTKIKHSELLKSKNPQKQIINDIYKNAQETLNEFKQRLKSKTTHPSEKKRLKSKIHVLEKLNAKLEQNLKFLDSHDENDLYESDETNGPILAEFIGEHIEIII